MLFVGLNCTGLLCSDSDIDPYIIRLQKKRNTDILDYYCYWLQYGKVMMNSRTEITIK